MQRRILDARRNGPAAATVSDRQLMGGWASAGPSVRDRNRPHFSGLWLRSPVSRCRRTTIAWRVGVTRHDGAALGSRLTE
jgi:hypothetical protein